MRDKAEQTSAVSDPVRVIYFPENSWGRDNEDQLDSKSRSLSLPYMGNCSTGMLGIVLLILNFTKIQWCRTPSWKCSHKERSRVALIIPLWKSSLLFTEFQPTQRQHAWLWPCWSQQPKLLKPVVCLPPSSLTYWTYSYFCYLTKSETTLFKESLDLYNGFYNSNGWVCIY